MPKLKNYRLANPDALIPMPDRGGRYFQSGPDGEVIDTENRFYATMIADGDLIEVKASSNAKGKSK